MRAVFAIYLALSMSILGFVSKYWSFTSSSYPCRNLIEHKVGISGTTEKTNRRQKATFVWIPECDVPRNGNGSGPHKVGAKTWTATSQKIKTSVGVFRTISVDTWNRTRVDAATTRRSTPKLYPLDGECILCYPYIVINTTGRSSGPDGQFGATLSKGKVGCGVFVGA